MTLDFKKTKIPQGYKLASFARYPTARRDKKSGRRYHYTVQLLNEETMDIPRGVGLTAHSALKHAIQNINGDDGLSKMIREGARGATH